MIEDITEDSKIIPSDFPELETAFEALDFSEYTFFVSDKNPLSQWYPAEFTVGEFSFNCAEQYMMFKKAMYFDDWETANLIMLESDPKKQKDLGRDITPFDEEKWKSVRNSLWKDKNSI